MTTEEPNLEDERLKSEIEFFKALTDSIKNPEKPKTSITKNKGISLAIISSLITVLAGGFALYLKVDDFLEQRMKAYSVTYTNQMINFVDKLKEKESWESDQAILLLSSYEMDAIPILLFNLEYEPSNRKEVYLRSLKMIREKKTVNKEKFIDKIIESSEDYLLSKFGKAFSNQEEQNQKEYALRNYIFILGELSGGFEKRVKMHLQWMKKKIIQDAIPEADSKRLILTIDRQIENL